MDANFAQWIVGQTGIAGVAIFALWVVREQNGRLQTMNDTLVSLIKSNTEAMTGLSNMVSDVNTTMRDVQQVVGTCTFAQRTFQQQPPK